MTPSKAQLASTVTLLAFVIPAHAGWLDDPWSKEDCEAIALMFRFYAAIGALFVVGFGSLFIAETLRDWRRRKGNG